MLNKVNNLLMSSSFNTKIKEFKNTSYTFSGTTSSSFNLPAGLTEGSLGILIISATHGATLSDIIRFGTPTGFTLLGKTETWNGATGRAASHAMFYRYLSSADSGTAVSSYFANSVADNAAGAFIEVVTNRDSRIRQIGYLYNGIGSAGDALAIISDVPANVPDNSPFFMLTCAADSLSLTGITYSNGSGGMETYSTSYVALNNTTYIDNRIWYYDNVLIQDLPDTSDAGQTVSGSGYGTSGVCIVWLN